MYADGTQSAGELLLRDAAELYELPEDWPPRLPMTAGDLATLIEESLREDDVPPCVAAVVFVELRRTVSEITGKPPQAVRPDMRVGDLIPMRDGKAYWDRICPRLGWRRPLLTRTGHDPAAFVAQVALAPFTLAISILITVSTYCAPQKLTVRDVVRHLMAVNRFVRFLDNPVGQLPAWLAGSRRPLHPDEDMSERGERIWYVVKRLVTDHTCRSPDGVHRGMRLDGLFCDSASSAERFT